MKSSLIAIVFAAILFGGLFFYLRGQSPSTDTNQTPSDTSASNQAATSTATNYDECIAEGNQPLADAPDKCLTKDGHIFIQGVVE